MQIPLNKPFYDQQEAQNLLEAVRSSKLSGNGPFTQQALQLLQQKFGLGNCLLTTSCTDALELAALLADISPADEVIIPAYTFPSTANAFLLRGATLKLCDSMPHSPNIDLEAASQLVTPKTKALVVVHYAGIAQPMEAVQGFCQANGLLLIEDAAQAFGASWQGKPLGTFGQFGAFSFHETKNISTGEGGALHIGSQALFGRARSMHDKGTNRWQFDKGWVTAYEWVAIGSSFLPSETMPALLCAQIQKWEHIQAKRLWLWEQYYRMLQPFAEKGWLSLPQVPEGAVHNATIFFVKWADRQLRDTAQAFLNESGVQAAFHYKALQLTKFWYSYGGKAKILHAKAFSECLLRFPLYAGLNQPEIDYISHIIDQLYKKLLK